MALRPEKKQIDYQSQIGVTRGRGFQAMASASQRSADVLDNLTEAYSERALKHIQDTGKKIGEEAAENVQFIDSSVSYLDDNGESQTIETRVPVKPLDTNLKSVQSAYDDVIAERYVNENINIIDKFLIEERVNAVTGNSSAKDYMVIVDDKLNAVLDSGLTPSVRTLLETKARSRIQEHGYAVEMNHQKHVQSVINGADKIVIEKLYIDALSGESVDLSVIDDLQGSDVKSETSQVIKNGIQSASWVGRLTANTSIEDLSKATSADVQTAVQDLASIGTLLNLQTKQITLSNGTVVTQKDVIDNVSSDDDRNKIITSINKKRESMNQYGITLEKQAVSQNILTTVISSGSNALLPLDNTTIADSFVNMKDQDEFIKEVKGMLKDANPEHNGEITELDKQVGFYILTGKVSTGISNTLNNLVSDANYEDLLKQQSRWLSLLTKPLFDNKEGDYQDKLPGLNLNKRTKEVLQTIRRRNSSGRTTESTIEFLKIQDNQEESRTYADIVKELENTDINNQSLMQNLVLDRIYDKLDITGDIDSDFVKVVMNDFKQRIRQTGFQEEPSKKDIKGIADDVIALSYTNKDNDKLMYGKSKIVKNVMAGYSDMQKKDKGESFVLYPVEGLYRLPGDKNAEWTHPLILKAAKQSTLADEFKKQNQNVDKKFTLGEKGTISISPIKGIYPPLYHMFYEDDINGKEYLIDVNQRILAISFEGEFQNKIKGVQKKAEEKQNKNLEKAKKLYEDKDPRKAGQDVVNKLYISGGLM
jgi:hypothetical protein